MEYAVIKNGIIVNVVLAEADFAADMGWVEFPKNINNQTVGIGWKYDGTSFTEPDPVVETTTAPTREELLAQLQALQTQIESL